MKTLWTASGVHRLEREVEELRKKIADATANEPPRQNSLSESKLAERIIAAHQEAPTARMLADKETLLGTLDVAPRPRQTKTVQIGQILTLKYLEGSRSKPGGTVERFLFGGDGEGDTDSSLHTVSCTSPLGRKLVNKSMSDSIDIQCPGGTYTVKIINIELPKEKTPAQ